MEASKSMHGGAAAAAPAVRFGDVRVTFLAKDDAFTAVERVDLEVADGEFVAIVGPTGCGKSTLLNAAAGLLAPSAGNVEIFGSRLGALNGQAGYLFQTESLFPWKTALENVAIGLEVAGVARRTARERARGVVGNPCGNRTMGSGRRGSDGVVRRALADSGRLCDNAA
jgi:NitT/TauT family transport system ATP-binding protein